jgi:hypothetical protein
MSNFCRRLANPKKLTGRKIRQRLHERCSKKYTSFNIFTKYGENTTIKTDRPMTEIEVHYIYGALCVSGID